MLSSLWWKMVSAVVVVADEDKGPSLGVRDRIIPSWVGAQVVSCVRTGWDRLLQRKESLGVNPTIENNPSRRDLYGLSDQDSPRPESVCCDV